MMEIPTPRAVPGNIKQTLELLLRRGSSSRGKPLNEMKRRELLQLIDGPGFGVLLDMMEEMCIAQETELVNLPGGNREAVLAQHALARGMWVFFGWLQRRIEFEINELYNPPDEEKPGVSGFENVLPEELLL